MQDRVATASPADAPAAEARVPRATLSSPAVLADMSAAPDTVEVTLTASSVRLSLVPDRVTDAYAYNGTVPGPTLEVREGDHVIVHFRNDLPEPTTVHWHGLHLPFHADGSPFHPVAPGASYRYEFTVRPGSAGTYWYHPHPHHVTGRQVGKGLYGAVIVRAPDDPLGALPEQLLILSDNRLLGNGNVDFAATGTMQGRIDFENGREGDLLFVNGGQMPVLDVPPGTLQRWRVINASAARSYRLAVRGTTLLHVGSDGGLFEHPVEREDVLIATAERVELLVRAPVQPGDSIVLESRPHDRYIPQTRPRDWELTRPLLTVRASDAARAAPVTVPATLRPIPVLDPATATATRVMVLTQGFINGQPMDMERVDVSASLDATEIWQVENLVGMDHPFHLHGFQFQVLDRNGVPEPFRSWKDVVNVPKHETVRFIVRYANYPGRWMFHCHILDHEDNGMMGVLEVKP